MKKFALYSALLLGLLSCQTQTPKARFTNLSSEKTGVRFANNLVENEDFNIIEYLYFYNGGGVAAGDVNNDGLPDLYFTSNQGQNKLYLNRGKMKFQDVTDAAGVGGNADWTTGVTMADVNGDGWLDIYVCNVGNYKGLKGKNELFINNGNETFTEQAAVYHLDFQGFATQAAFFDYDNDGDLDCYLLNHSVHDAARRYDASFRTTPNTVAGDRLLRNDDLQFVDVSTEAGIFSSKIGYGLGVAISDFNQDGCLDIYVSNDFRENDYLYYNNCDGTFKEGAAFSMGHQSNFSMGSDVADFNNDGRPDLMTLDMKPESEEILKKSAGADPYDVYMLKLQDGFHYQYPRNNLHLNQGTLFGRAAVFSEVGQLAGVDATDWSWSALFSDLDNDGFKDLFITNGIVRRPNDLNYLKFTSNEIVQHNATDLEIAQQMPDGKVANYCYRNEGNLHFENVTKRWGLEHVGVSNGAAYADLDGDGDLDLITNNLNETARIYQNNTDTSAHFLKIRLKGEGQNTFGIGAKVLIQHQGRVFYQEQNPTRGFQSSVDYDLNFGLGDLQRVDSVTVIWGNGIYETRTNVRTNQIQIFKQTDANKLFVYTPQKPSNPLFINVSKEITNPDFLHQENAFSDFSVQRLLLQALSTEGPKMAVGDVNGDGLEDVFLCGAKGQSGSLHCLRFKGDRYALEKQNQTFDPICEDVDAAFFDADGDKDLDLYVVSAGNEWSGEAEALLDRLYWNDGKGNFTKSDRLPKFYANGSCVRPFDYDQDGDLDLFVGSRVLTNQYGIAPTSVLLKNDGKGGFSIEKTAAFEQLGMVTDAIWADVDGDKRTDLVVVGEFMPMTIFKNLGKNFEKITVPNSSGWWNTLQMADLDNDGDLDFVLGNHGLNSDLTASPNQPFRLYVKDFDQNGSLEQLFCYHNGNTPYPFASQDELISQLPSKKKDYLRYDDYARSQIEDVFGAALADARQLQAVEMRSVWAENRGNGGFTFHALPTAAQVSPVRSILIEDFDGDGNQDILLGGNFYSVLPKLGRSDASFGNFLQGDGNGNFTDIEALQTGWAVTGEVRDLKMMTVGNNKVVLVGRNDDAVLVFVWRQPETQ